MYDILDPKELELLREKEPERFQYLAEGGFYLNLKGLDLKPPAEIDLERAENLARLARGLAFCAINSARSGHPGGSSSKVEQVLALICAGVLAFDPMAPKNPGRDRIVWSAGHCTPLFHAVLALIYESLQRSGKEIDKEKLGAVLPDCLVRFRHCDGPAGHVESRYAFSDATTGASGHGFSMAAGLALLQKSNGLDSKVWVIAGDAETEEGMSYEARNLIKTLGLDNIVVTLDFNHFGIDGPIEEVVSTAYLNHWFALGWNVIEVDGHNFLELAAAYRKAAQGFSARGVPPRSIRLGRRSASGGSNGKATVVICHTIKGKYYGKLAGTADSHGTPAPQAEYVEIMKKLGFDIPGVEGQAKEDIDVIVKNLKEEDVEYLLARLDVCQKNIKSENELVKKIEKNLAGRPLIDYKKILRPEILPPELQFKEGENIATRKATEAFFKWLMGQTAFFYIGAGDLAKSILTGAAEGVYGIINKENPLGRGVRFGIAEQNMAMLSCALTQDILPGGWQAMSVFSTYGVFTSLMANQVRMSLIGNAVNPARKGFFIMLAAHDGPETGEDGPTHQGLFWMALFDAYPGIKVYKPLDANETIEMLFYALQKNEPVAFSVMRPNTPVFKRGAGAYGDFTVPEARQAIKGAYVFKPFAENGKKKMILVVCGGQVMANILEILPDLENVSDVKIIAVTSPEIFEEFRAQNPKEADEILSEEERQYVITAHNGWSGFLDRFILPADYPARTLEINQFLKAGPPKEVYESAEFDAQGIKKQILEGLGKLGK